MNLEEVKEEIEKCNLKLVKLQEEKNKLEAENDKEFMERAVGYTYKYYDNWGTENILKFGKVVSVNWNNMYLDTIELRIVDGYMFEARYNSVYVGYFNHKRIEQITNEEFREHLGKFTKKMYDKLLEKMN